MCPKNCAVTVAEKLSRKFTYKFAVFKLPIDDFIKLGRARSNRVRLARRNVPDKQHFLGRSFGARQSIDQPLVLVARVAVCQQNPKVLVVAKVGVDGQNPEAGPDQLRVLEAALAS